MRDVLQGSEPFDCHSGRLACFVGRSGDVMMEDSKNRLENEGKSVPNHLNGVLVFVPLIPFNVS